MYYCKNCGEAYASDEAVMCVKCGVAKGQGTGYCHNCGKPLTPGAEVCLNCGVSAKGGSAGGANGPKQKIVAGLLGIFLGSFGVHNFYLGFKQRAIIQLCVSVGGILLSCCTFGITSIATAGIGIWGLVEGIMILCGKIDKDADGNPLV